MTSQIQLTSPLLILSGSRTLIPLVLLPSRTLVHLCEHPHSFSSKSSPGCAYSLHPHLFRAHLAHPGGSGSPPPPPSIPSGPRLTFIRFRRASLLTLPPRFRPAPARDLSAHVRRRTRPPSPFFSSTPVHTPASFPTGSARFKRPRAASNAAILRSLLGTSHFLIFVHSLFASHGSAHLSGILHSFITLVSLLAFSGHFVICFRCSVHFPGGFRSP